MAVSSTVARMATGRTSVPAAKQERKEIEPKQGVSNGGTQLEVPSQGVLAGGSQPGSPSQGAYLGVPARSPTNMASKRDSDYIGTIKRDRVEREPTERS